MGVCWELLFGMLSDSTFLLAGMSSSKTVINPVDPTETRGLYFNARVRSEGINDLFQHLAYREGTCQTHPGKPVAW